MSPDPEPPDAPGGRPDPALRVLGPIELTTGTGGLGSSRLRRAAAVFTIHAGTVLTADRLVDLIWRRDLPSNPDAALHTVVSRLRRRLAAAGLGDRLLTRPPGYLLRLSPGDCDALMFIDLVERAAERLTTDPLEADGCASAALGLWRGPAYAEFVDLEVAAVEAARLAEYRSRAAELRIQAALVLHRPDRALMLAEQEIATAGLREGPRRWQMLALYRLAGIRMRSPRSPTSAGPWTTSWAWSRPPNWSSCSSGSCGTIPRWTGTAAGRARTRSPQAARRPACRRRANSSAATRRSGD